MTHKYANYTVTFVGDYFSLTHFVELDLTDPTFAELDEDGLEESAIDMAHKNLMYHYGWDLAKTAWETSVEVDYSPAL